MLNLIARRHGAELANLVADQMIHTSIRSDRDAQRLSIPTRIGVRHPKLAEVIARMEAQHRGAGLADDARPRRRHVDPAARAAVPPLPRPHARSATTWSCGSAQARNLLMQTDMSVINVALACGFTSPSHFSKCYRALYRTTPYRERGTSEAPAG